jgi:protein-ribulosamine 3-kinase
MCRSMSRLMSSTHLLYPSEQGESSEADRHRPYIYDASAFWGHNECEFQDLFSFIKALSDTKSTLDDLHNWRGARFRLSKEYVKEYFKNFPMSPPQEDWDDRNLLYSM